MITLIILITYLQDILIVSGVSGLIILATLRVAGKIKGSNLLPVARESEAIILSVDKTGFYINNKPQVKLRLQVMPEKGRNYIAEAISVLNEAEVSAGTKVRVTFSPRNRQEVKLLASL